MAIIDAFLVTKNHYDWISRLGVIYPDRLHFLGFPHYPMVYLICFCIEHRMNWDHYEPDLTPIDFPSYI